MGNKVIFFLFLKCQPHQYIIRKIVDNSKREFIVHHIKIRGFYVTSSSLETLILQCTEFKTDE